jgi:uncharacterized protein YgiM (DUF1202 family)
MLPAPNARISLILAITFSAAALVLPSSTRAAAGAPQRCVPSETCVVGEYLYDDSYTPITTADICELDVKEPDGDAYLTGQNMPPSAQGDGFYSHSFTAPVTEGYYRAEVCCSPGGEKLCLDKSFEVKSDASSLSTGSIATAVWGYSDKTLSNFGTLVSDIWSHSSRTFSSFGNLISNIWSSSTRTLTSSGVDTSNLATKDDIKASTGSANIATINTTVNESRLLLEQLVNKPIIENFIDEGPVPDLQSKVKDTKTVASQLYANTQYINSKARLIASRWYSLDEKALLDGVMELSGLLGEENDAKGTNSVFGQVNWVKSSWDWDLTEDLYTQTKVVRTGLSAVENQLGSYGKTKASYNEIRTLAGKLDGLVKTIGQTNDSAFTKTLYGKLGEVEDLAKVLDSRSADVDKVLAGWSENKSKKTIKTTIEDLVKRILAINKVPNARKIFAGIDTSKPEEKILKNKLLGAKAVIGANQLLLARGSGKPLINTWLEEGSIVFKSLVTNPSKLISQEVPLKYYLPSEVTKESIISISDGMSVEYDTEKNQFYVQGTYTLGPGESTTVSVTVDDSLWNITDDELGSIRTQAENLAKPLEKTAFFAQGVTLKSDIIASLDKAKGLRDAAITPEQKIRAYREADIEITSANEKLGKLKDLVTQASSTGTLFGFVGGTQTLAVWGLIIIMAAGFVFLALYMRALGLNNLTKEKKQKPKKDQGTGKTGGEMFEAPKKKFRMGKLIQVALPLIIVAVVSGTISALVSRSVILASVARQQAAAVSEPQVLAKTDEETPAEVPSEDLGVGGEDIVKIVVPEGSSVNLRSGPSANNEIIMRLETSQEATRIGEESEWVNIVLDNTDSLDTATEGWVSKKFIEEPTVEESDPEENLTQTLTVKETPTGWLRVRETPGTAGEEVAKVNPGETFSVIAGQNGWFQIELPDGITGWVSGAYASVE